MQHLLLRPTINHSRTYWKKIQQWTLRISEYNCKFEYLSGRENTYAGLLSRIPIKLKLESDSVKQVNDKAYQIKILILHNLEDRLKLDEADTEMEEGNSQGYQEILAGNIQEDEVIQAIKETIELENTPKTRKYKFLVQDGLVYHISGKGEDIRPRLYVAKIIRGYISKKSHDNMGHLGVEKKHDLISGKNYWPGLYKNIKKFVNACMICQSRSGKQKVSPLLKTYIPSYPFKKISMNISGPYGESS